MRGALVCIVGTFCAACGAELAGGLSTTSGTTAGQATTTGTGGTTGGGTSTGSSSTSTGGGGTIGTAPVPCPSNQFVCPSGTAKAGQFYPGALLPDCGTVVGDTLPNLELQGGAILNFSKTEVTDDTRGGWSSSASMLDLYCSGFRFVFIDISTIWCAKSADQASFIVGGTIGRTTPNDMYQKWLNAGGIVFSAIEQGATNGPASRSDLMTWIARLGVSFPIAIDSNEAMDTLVGVTGWPTNLIVDLNSMRVVWSGTGFYLAYYQTYCDILGITGPCVP
jgi:hypothetical protein